MRKVRSDLTLEEEFADQPPSPGTQKELHRKKDLIAAVQVGRRRRGRSSFIPKPRWESFSENENQHNGSAHRKMTISNDVPDDIYQTMSRILDEVRQMVRSFPMREVKKSDLDECVRNLAAAAFPDPSQHSLQSHYVRAATGLLRQILIENDKVIVETVPEKELLLHVGDLVYDHNEPGLFF